MALQRLLMARQIREVFLERQKRRAVRDVNHLALKELVSLVLRHAKHSINVLVV